VSQDKRARLKQWLESGETRLEPLTFSQRELWEVSPLPVEDASNHICAFFEVRGALESQDWELAVRRVVERQEVMRLSVLPGKERPLQMIRASGVPVIRFRELSTSQSRPEAIDDLMREIFSEPFDLVQGPLYRVDVLRRAVDDHLLVLTIHHAIADGWSLGAFVHDLWAAHLQKLMGVHSPLSPVPQTYSAWGAAERAQWQPAELERRATFWKSRLAGTSRLWNIPVRSQAESEALQRWISFVPSELARSVRELARRTGTTLFSTLLTVFQIALSRWTGADDIVVGTPVANRTKQSARETMGYCAGIVPLRGRIAEDRPLSDSLRATHQAVVDSFANAMPFVELVRALGESPPPGHNPIFEVRFALQNHPIPDVSVPGLSARLRMRSTGTPRFNLGCEITEDGGALEVVWLFRRNQFSGEDIQNLDGMFQSGLAKACRATDTRTVALMT
jgi:Condensation domain